MNVSGTDHLNYQQNSFNQDIVWSVNIQILHYSTSEQYSGFVGALEIEFWW